MEPTIIVRMAGIVGLTAYIFNQRDGEEQVMLYELRVYDVIPGKLAALNDRFEHLTTAYFEKHGIKVVGFWTDVIGSSNRLTYMLAYEDLAHRERAWSAFASDQERLAKFAETEREGPLVAKVTNTLMAPTRYSPLR